jgi:hypothetical protein
MPQPPPINERERWFKAVKESDAKIAIERENNARDNLALSHYTTKELEDQIQAFEAQEKMQAGDQEERRQRKLK